MPDSSGLTLHDTMNWQALTGVQKNLAEGDELARRYPAAVGPFAATVDVQPASFRSLLNLLRNDERIALCTTQVVQPPPAFVVVGRDSIDQMTLANAPAFEKAPESPIEPLGVADVPEMLALTSMTQPGPFGTRTIELGNYIGIRQQGALVAMAGERMRLSGFTEISAVCVDPAYRGHGFAADLIRTLAASIVARSEVPFLHVFSSNHAAIALYHKLGFTLRRQMHLATLRRADAEGNAVPSQTLRT